MPSLIFPCKGLYLCVKVGTLSGGFVPLCHVGRWVRAGVHDSRGGCKINVCVGGAEFWCTNSFVGGGAHGHGGA